jgi:hypothetical protein
MMVEKAAVGRGRGRRREKKRESKRGDRTAGMAEQAATPLGYLSVGSTRATRSGCVGGSQRKGVHFGDHRSRANVHGSHETLILRKVGVLKRHVVCERAGELRSRFYFSCATGI